MAASDTEFVSRMLHLALDHPAEALVRLWLHLRVYPNLEAGLDRGRVSMQGRKVLEHLADGTRLHDASIHPAAALRAVDDWLALLESGHSPLALEVAIEGVPSPAYWVVPRRAGWRSAFSEKQPGQLAFWLLRHQVLPRNLEGIEIEVRDDLPDAVRARLSGKPLKAACGGFADGVEADWTKHSPYTCTRLLDSKRRTESVREALERARIAEAAIIVFPELTIDVETRSALYTWLRETSTASLALVVAGSFHERGDGPPDPATGLPPSKNVSWLVDPWGEVLHRHEKLRPMRTTAENQPLDEGIGVGSKVTFFTSPLGLLGVAICQDFCEEGDVPITRLWQAVGPALMLVPSMGEGTTNSAHRRRAEALAREHATITVLASQPPPPEPPLKESKSGVGWVFAPGKTPESARPLLFWSVEW